MSRVFTKGGTFTSKALTGDTIPVNESSGVQEYTSGSGTFVVPEGVYRIEVIVVGGGGGGGGSGTGTDSAICGGGGGGTVLKSVRVSPGQEFSYSVGSAGISSTLSGADVTITANAGATGSSSPYVSRALGGAGSGGQVIQGGSGYAFSLEPAGQSSIFKSIGGDSSRGSGGITDYPQGNSQSPAGYGAGGQYASLGTGGYIRIEWTEGDL